MNKKLKITKNNFWGIKNPEWWFQETPGVFQLCYPWAKAYTQIEKYYKSGYGIIVVPFRNDYIWQVLEKKRSIKLAQYVLGEHQKNPGFILNKIERWKKLKDILLNNCNQVQKLKLSSVTPKRLWEIYYKLYQAHTQQIIPALVIESFEPFVSDVFLKKLSSKGLDAQKLSVLEQPSAKSFLTQERVEFLKLCLWVFAKPKLFNFLKKSKKTKNDLEKVAKSFPNFYKKLEEYSSKFFWIRNNYKDIYYLSSLFYFKLLVDELKKSNELEMKKELHKLAALSLKTKRRRKEVIEEFNLSPKLVSTYKLLETLAWWIDERKKTILIANHYINELLLELTKRVNFSLNEIQYARPSEIKEILLRNKSMDKKILQERRRFSIWIGKKDQEFWFTGKEAQKIWNIIFKKKGRAKKAVCGIPASIGRVEGKVRIVLDPKKDRFLKGEILVTSMTRPEFVPLMRKAKGVVTNEGGITCHAAIVSRELGIPCVVGTKIATKALKNGEKVLLRAHRGMVERID